MKLKISKKPAWCILLIALSFSVTAKDYSILSPDNKTEIRVAVGENINWSVLYENEVLINPSKLALELDNGTVLGEMPKIKKAKNTSVNSEIEATIPVKNRLIEEKYNQLTIDFAGNYSVTFRAYDDGVAYRFETSLKDDELVIKNEVVEYNFPDNFQVAWPSSGSGFGIMRQMMTTASEPGFGSKNPESGRRRGNFGGGPGGGAPVGTPAGATNPNRSQMGEQGSPPAGGGFPQRRERSPFSDSYEYLFGDSLVASVNETAGLPVYFSSTKGTKMVVLESDLYDYPNLFLKGTGTNSMLGVFPPSVIGTSVSRSPFGGENETADYIAKTKATRTFPWRAVVISPNDAGLLESDLVYKLASPSVIDASWVKPGQVAWEWYNGTNIYGVNFESGINTPTYKYYIDFASKYYIPYLLIDAGWLNNDDGSHSLRTEKKR